MQALELIKERLVRELEIYYSKNGKLSTDSTFGIHRIEVPVEDIDLINWLWRQPHKDKLFWSGRNKKFRVAGAGVAHRISNRNSYEYADAFQEMYRNFSHSHSNIKYFGGMRFNPESSSDEQWRAFKNFNFWVPQFEIVEKEGNKFLAYNFPEPRKSELRYQKYKLYQKLENLHLNGKPFRAIIPKSNLLKTKPSRAEWDIIIQKALELIDDALLQKIVLARMSDYQFEDVIEPLALLQNLLNLNSHSYHFYFQPGVDYGFLGATPEQLYERQQKQIFSDAIAGTRPRSENVDKDQQLGRDLLESDKDRREHRWVSNFVREKLEMLCSDVEALSSEALLKLNHIQHLHSSFRGKLKDNQNDGNIIDSLHPTPAVGGCPHKPAMKNIAELERFDRGWYAAPVGWIAPDAAEFAVAIRSATVAKNQVKLYAGAGIVSGSDAEMEWRELDNKILNFTQLFKTG